MPRQTDRDAIRGDLCHPARQLLGDRFAAAGIERSLQLDPQIILEALLECTVIAGAVIEYPLNRSGQIGVVFEHLLHMREKGLAIVAGRIGDGDRVDRDPLLGEPDEAGLVAPDHLVPGFHDRPGALVAQDPLVRTRLPILAPTPLGQLRL